MSLVDFFFFKQKTAYEMRISDWSSDVCSSDLPLRGREGRDRLSPTRQTTRRRTPAPWLARSACDLAPAMWVVTLGQDRLRAWGAQRVGPRCRAAAGANPSLRTPKAKELELMSPF